MTWLAKLIPSMSWLWAVIGAAVLAVGGYVVALHIEVANVEAQAETAKEGYATRIAESEKALSDGLLSQAALKDQLTQANEAINEAQLVGIKRLDIERKARVDAVAAQQSVDSVRRAAVTAYAASRPAASCAASAPQGTDDRPRLLGELLNESADLLREGQGVALDARDAAQRAQLQISGLQTYITTVAQPINPKEAP